MAHGQLQCAGSGMFLKKQYGPGYHLTIVYTHNVSNGSELAAENLRETAEIM